MVSLSSKADISRLPAGTYLVVDQSLYTLVAFK